MDLPTKKKSEIVHMNKDHTSTTIFIPHHCRRNVDASFTTRNDTAEEVNGPQRGPCGGELHPEVSAIPETWNPYHTHTVPHPGRALLGGK